MTGKEYAKDQKDSGFKFNAQTIATIALVISSINMIMIGYNIFFK